MTKKEEDRFPDKMKLDEILCIKMVIVSRLQKHKPRDCMNRYTCYPLGI